MLSIGDGRVLFDANGDELGAELWITDGTKKGMQLVADIYGGFESGQSNQIAALGDGTFLFSAIDGHHGRELWATDGTFEGTHIVRDINKGSGPSSPYGNRGDRRGRALFSADDGKHGCELWICDGTKKGTYCWPTSMTAALAQRPAAAPHRTSRTRTSRPPPTC